MVLYNRAGNDAELENPPGIPGRASLQSVAEIDPKNIAVAILTTSPTYCRHVYKSDGSSSAGIKPRRPLGYGYF